jgi:hypothetical protein
MQRALLSAYQLTDAIDSKTLFSTFYHSTFTRQSFYHNMSDSYSDYENRINEVIDALHNHEYTNCAAADRAFEIAIRILRKR